MSNCPIQAGRIESPECQGIPERICKFSSPLVASIQVESTESVIFVLSTLFLAFEHTDPNFALYVMVLCVRRSRTSHEIPWNIRKDIVWNESVLCVFEGYG